VAAIVSAVDYSRRFNLLISRPAAATPERDRISA
jgi:hypothetical protein